MDPDSSPRSARSRADSPVERLVAERRRTERRLAELRRDFDDIVVAAEGSNADDEHDPEGTTIAFERSQVDALVRQSQQRLREVDVALERVREGSYGTCKSCGRRIDPARLEARPMSIHCVECARQKGRA